MNASAREYLAALVTFSRDNDCYHWNDIVEEAPILVLLHICQGETDAIAALGNTESVPEGIPFFSEDYEEFWRNLSTDFDREKVVELWAEVRDRFCNREARLEERFPEYRRVAQWFYGYLNEHTLN